MPADAFLRSLAIVLCVAAATTIVFQRLKQPVVLGYILAGLIVGPHLPVPLIADRDIVRTLGELGVILLMFCIGLELSLRKLGQLGLRSLLVAIVEVGFTFGIAFAGTRLMGWSSTVSLFAAAMLSISSTTIVAKIFAERGVTGKHRQLVFGTLVAEDLIAIVLLTSFTAIAAGAGLSPHELVVTLGHLAGFLAGLIVVGMLIVPRLIRRVLALDHPETTLLAATGLCFGAALLARAFGYSVALGAFLAGALVAEAGQAHPIERVVTPLRDLFAAIFFVAVGMQIDPQVIVAEWRVIGLFVAFVLVGKVVGVAVGVFATGHGVRLAVRAAMSLAQTGEFSFLIAGLALPLGGRARVLVSIAAAVSAITTLLTPWMIGVSNPVASWVDRRLPPRLQTFASLYGSWFERIGRGAARPQRVAGRAARRLLVDVTALVLLTLAVWRWLDEAVAFVAHTAHLELPVARAVLIGVVFIAGSPFVLGIGRLTRRLGQALAFEALPPAPPGQVDLSQAPRRLLSATFQLIAILLSGVPLVALGIVLFSSLSATLVAVGVLLATVLFVARSVWRGAADVEGHVRAGTEALLAALARGAGPGVNEHSPLQEVSPLLPGLGAPVPIRLSSGSPAIGRTLGSLDLRGQTGATVLAIRRGEAGVVGPGASERLVPDDELLLAGSEAAIAAARELLG